MPPCPSVCLCATKDQGLLLKDTGALKYIAWGEEQGYHNVEQV